MAAWDTRKTPSKLVAITLRHLSKSVSSIGPKSAIPALFTSASIWPAQLRASAIMPCTVFGSDTSQTSPMPFSNAFALFSSASASQSTSTIFQPASCIRWAVASPIPLAAPVMITVLRADGVLVSIGVSLLHAFWWVNFWAV